MEMVDLLRDPQRFPNPEINRSVAFMRRFILNGAIRVAVDPGYAQAVFFGVGTMGPNEYGILSIPFLSRKINYRIANPTEFPYILPNLFLLDSYYQVN
jgi:hypothetical protein